MNSAALQPDQLAAALKAKARELGFSLAGVCPAVDASGVSNLDLWLAHGYAGDMDYIAERRAAYAHPRHVLEGVRSLLMLAMNYRTADPLPVQTGQGRIARYAWGEADYHDLIRDRLHALADYLREFVPDAVTRGVVDTAPFLEREYAQLAGLGWVGKNTLILNRQAGSYFFLAAILTDAHLQPDSPHAADHCGTCTACLDACPTQAFPQPYVLDASKCLSYLTIENRGQTPLELRPGAGDWLFGCDVCQEVCPWNRHAPLADEPVFAPREGMNPIELAELFKLSDDDFRRRFRATPLWRPHRRGLLRNAAVVLGNQRATQAVPALSQGLNDLEPIVRAACAWALGRIFDRPAASALHNRLILETDESVLAEIREALSADPPPA